jgi:threonine-phosphate decarboxylase
MLQQYDNLYILSSLTKLFASPGIRMGYILSRKENIEELRRQLPEWNLSVTAEEAVKAGCRALTGTAFAEETRELIRRERAFLAELLAEKGLKVFESQSAFLLFKGPDDLYVRLLQRGILIRDCSSFPGLGRGYYRIAVKNHADNLLFKQALEEVL